MCGIDHFLLHKFSINGVLFWPSRMIRHSKNRVLFSLLLSLISSWSTCKIVVETSKYAAFGFGERKVFRYKFSMLVLLGGVTTLAVNKLLINLSWKLSFRYFFLMLRKLKTLCVSQKYFLTLSLNLWSWVWQVMMRLFSPRKTTMLFVIRDKTRVHSLLFSLYHSSYIADL